MQLPRLLEDIAGGVQFNSISTSIISFFFSSSPLLPLPSYVTTSGNKDPRDLSNISNFHFLQTLGQFHPLPPPPRLPISCTTFYFNKHLDTKQQATSNKQQTTKSINNQFDLIGIENLIRKSTHKIKKKRQR
ncbi:hypothetical protein EYC80_001309 [Monilinia laxa]|uniref:Uncharacterized protein n=1 Tax=Monilinia laxa TaxID=61186 RepID=A0A5N6K8W7_MONLA|nr:hypothetical protein EYC80_001309 [Monilinia laxa]